MLNVPSGYDKNKTVCSFHFTGKDVPSAYDKSNDLRLPGCIHYII